MAQIQRHDFADGSFRSRGNSYLVVVKPSNMNDQETPAETRSIGTSSPRRAAFTLTELLVVIAIVAVLFSLALPGLAGAGSRSRVAQCGSNLKQFAMVLELYGMDNHNNLPRDTAGNWPWDVSSGVIDDLMPFGATRDMMYCPANPDQNNDALWFYAGGSIHVIGYAMTCPGTPALLFTNINSSLIPQRIVFGPLLMPPPPSSKRVLVADGTLSLPGQKNTANRAANTYTGITGGAFVNGQIFQHRTSHLNGALPAGGNVGMLDGHVEWRKFNDMIPRDDPSAPSFDPEFWW